jgi:hypothetical protein
VVEAGIDEPRTFRGGLPTPGRIVEEVASLFGGSKHEGRGEEDRRLRRSFRQRRVIAVAEHQGLRLQYMIADPDFVIARAVHGGSPWLVGALAAPVACCWPVQSCKDCADGPDKPSRHAFERRAQLPPPLLGKPRLW